MTGHPERSSRFAYALVLLAAIVVQAMIGLQAWQHWGSRNRELADKTRELGNIVHILQHDTARTIGQVDAALREIAALPRSAESAAPRTDRRSGGPARGGLHSVSSSTSPAA